MADDRRAQQIAAVRETLAAHLSNVASECCDPATLAGLLVDAVEAVPRIPADQVGAYAARGFGRRNPHCSNCGDERGGPFGHEISECGYRDGMSVSEMVQLPHLAERRAEVWDHYIDRYFEHEPIRRQAEARGYQQAIANLLDTAGYKRWHQQVYATTGVDHHRWNFNNRVTLADYLEAVAPGRPSAPDGATP